MSANEKTSLIQTTDPLDLNELREKVQGLLEERNERLKGYSGYAGLRRES